MQVFYAGDLEGIQLAFLLNVKTEWIEKCTTTDGVESMAEFITRIYFE